MSIYEEAPAADPRALLSAAALGSIAGMVLGGGYLLAARLGSTPSTYVTASSPAAVSPLVAAVAPLSHAPTPHDPTPHEPTSAAAPTVQPTSRLQLRWLHFAAPPFRPASVEADHDRECLTQAVYYEARGEGPAGQQAVAQVVLNRVRHPAFPKSVCGVVFQRSSDGCQFSFACERRPGALHEAAAWGRARAVADHALDGFVMRQVGEATHFHVSNLAVDWSQGLARVAQIGAHVFYGLTGRSERRLESPHAAPMQEARATTTPQGPPVATPVVDPRVHLVLAAEPITTSPPATIDRTEPASTTASAAKPADIVAPPTVSLADTH